MKFLVYIFEKGIKKQFLRKQIASFNISEVFQWVDVKNLLKSGPINKKHN